MRFSSTNPDPANVEFFPKNSTKAKSARPLKESGCDDIILGFVSDNRLERQHTISITHGTTIKKRWYSDKRN
jgi:hypothetical protein